MKNVIFSTYINPIGGVETVIYNIVKKYRDRDITVMYKEADAQQLYRLSRYCDLVEYKGQQIECDNLFVNYGWEIIKDNVKAKKKYYVVHANYEFLNQQEKENGWPLTLVPDGFEVLAVSKYAGDRCGKPYRLCYNPADVSDKRALILVSATRLNVDKGTITKRMTILADELEKRKIPFIWLIFTNSKKKIPNRNCINVSPRLDITPYIKMADFVVQLSDSEACCMTVLESMISNTPVICTKIPSFYEQGLNEQNSLFLDFDMSNLNEVVNHIYDDFNFKFTPKPDIWGDLLVGKREKEVIPMKTFRVKANENFLMGGGITCKVLGRVPEVGEVFEINEVELKPLLGENAYKVKFVDIIEEIPEQLPLEMIENQMPGTSATTKRRRKK